MRSRFALVALLVVLSLLVVQAGTAGARPARQAATWHYVHFHLNAYSHWGSCNAEWHHHSGKCTGLLEEGTFIGHSWPHSEKVIWYWQGSDLSVDIGRQGGGWGNSLTGTKPGNWYTFSVKSARLTTPTSDGYYETGTDGKAGHEGGPLFVNLTSHSFSTSYGYSFDIYGYLRLKPRS